MSATKAQATPTISAVQIGSVAATAAALGVVGVAVKSGVQQLSNTLSSTSGRPFVDVAKTTLNTVDDVVSNVDIGMQVYERIKGISNVSSTFKTAGKVLGVAGTVLSAASNAFENFTNDNLSLGQKIGYTVTDTAVDAAASYGCAIAGAAVGSLVVPPIGTAVGIVVGIGINFLINAEIFGGKSIVGWVQEGVHAVYDAVAGVVKGVFNFFFGNGDRGRPNQGERDFTLAKKQELLQTVKRLDSELGGLFDWVGDRWLEAGLPTTKDYASKLLDIHNTTPGEIEQIWDQVGRIDSTYASKFNADKNRLNLALQKLRPLFGGSGGFCGTPSLFPGIVAGIGASIAEGIMNAARPKGVVDVMGEWIKQAVMANGI
jgi:hypothetical protein